jgi:hypothetical protein
MFAKRCFAILIATLAVGVSPAWSQSTYFRPFSRSPYSPNCPPIPCETVPYMPGQVLPGQVLPGQTDPGTTPPGATPPGQTDTPDLTTPSDFADAFAQAPPAGTSAEGNFTPNMFGDIIGGPSLPVVVPIFTADPSTPQNRIRVNRVAVIPQLARGAFKIADNESPRPVDRVFAFYNYYNGVADLNGTLAPFDVHREVIGFEKTFWQGNASIGMRLPFIQTAGTEGSIDDSQVGDLTIISKFALLNNRMNGDVVSAGLAITVPTGDALPSVDGGTIHPTLLQPYLGYIFNFDNIYLQGFSSLVVPTDSDDTPLMFNDIGIGYWLYKNPCGGLVTGVAPTFECHVLTPLDDRYTNGGTVPDWVVLTGGTTFILQQNSTLGVAIGAPVTGPNPFDMQATVSFNFNF